MADPCEGGCWYCCSDEKEMVFSVEFDTWLHLDCLRQAMAHDPHGRDREARILARELLGDEVILPPATSGFSPEE